MFAEQRYEKIMLILQKYKHVDVSSLTSILQASEATVRRDLDKLEKDGLLRRTHGGATLVEAPTSILEKPAFESNDPLEIEINQIGKIAANLIDDGDIIAIGAGGLGLALARNTNTKKQFSVVTNDILIMTELLRFPNVQIIMVGGLTRVLSDKLIYTSGDFTLQMLNDFSVNKAFLSVDGISLTKGLMAVDYEYALIWKKIHSISDQLIIMAVHQAFGNKGMIRLADMTDINRIITTPDIDMEYQDFFLDHNIAVHLSLDL